MAESLPYLPNTQSATKEQETMFQNFTISRFSTILLHFRCNLKIWNPNIEFKWKLKTVPCILF